MRSKVALIPQKLEKKLIQAKFNLSIDRAEIAKRCSRLLHLDLFLPLFKAHVFDKRKYYHCIRKPQKNINFDVKIEDEKRTFLLFSEERRTSQIKIHLEKS